MTWRMVGCIKDKCFYLIPTTGRWEHWCAPVELVLRRLAALNRRDSSASSR